MLSIKQSYSMEYPKVTEEDRSEKLKFIIKYILLDWDYSNYLVKDGEDGFLFEIETQKDALSRHETIEKNILMIIIKH
jgi:hypothetical protein